MKHTILIALMCCFWGMPVSALPVQQEKPRALPSGTDAELPKGLFPSGNEVLVGSVVRYDASLSSHSPEEDMALRLREGDDKYVRLLYSPHDFGFDAPPATEEQLLPTDMFSDSNLVWTFRVHSPRNEAERSACTSVRKQLAPEKDGQLVEIERYTAVPGAQDEQVPKPESLRCVIVESWSRESGDAVTSCRISVPREAQEADFVVLYKFQTKDGQPVNITKVKNDFLKDDDFTACISRWALPSLTGQGLAEFSYKHAEGWTEITVSGKGFRKSLHFGDDPRP